MLFIFQFWFTVLIESFFSTGQGKGIHRVFFLGLTEICAAVGTVYRHTGQRIRSISHAATRISTSQSVGVGAFDHKIAHAFRCQANA
jgi:hypothetical protein